MRTRTRLNWGFFVGSLVTAGLIGTVYDSELVFLLAAIGLVLLNVARKEIRRE